MSPAGATSLEDQQYMEKLKQLSKYIEPLRRMINKIDKNEGETIKSVNQLVDQQLIDKWPIIWVTLFRKSGKH